MPGDSFDKAWVLGGVTQGFAQPLDRVIQSLIEINERVSRPDSPSELLPRDDLARMLQQHLQKMEGLLLELYLDALLRSEERRVGKECRYRWWPHDEEKRI